MTELYTCLQAENYIRPVDQSASWTWKFPTHLLEVLGIYFGMSTKMEH